MKIKLFGTRGSIPVAGCNYNQYGGNTTSLEVESVCLPPRHHLVIDAGSGFVPLSLGILKQHGEDLFSKGVTVSLLFSHWHHDHTQGLLLSPLTFIDQARMCLYGPEDHGVGPREMLEQIMQPPFFPVHWKKVEHHFAFKKMEFPDANVILFHPKGGVKILAVADFQRLVANTGHVPVGKNGKYPIEECLVIKMYRSNHPERTTCYRIEERPTGKVFVFLTDHENQDGIPADLRRHLTGADLLILDAQYNQSTYDSKTCGFGHGTGPYCVWLALACGVKKVGLTHHDPFAGDEQVENNLAEAKARLKELIVNHPQPTLTEDDVFACQDYQTIEM